MADINSSDLNSLIDSLFSNSPENATEDDMRKVYDKLDELKKVLQDIAKNSSQSQAQDFRSQTRYNPYENRYSGKRSSRFIGNFDDQISKALGLDKIEDEFHKTFSGIAKEFGVTLDDLPGTLGETVGKSVADKIKSSPIGQSITNSMQDITKTANESLAKAGSKLAKEGVGPAMSEMAAGVKAIVPKMGPILVALVALEAIEFVLSDVLASVDAVGKSFDEYKASMNRARKRDQESRNARTANANARIAADVKAIVEQPFKVLEEAAGEMQKAWESSIRVINQTQGYSKADLQDLISSYSQRLRSEGLSSVVSAADLTTNLESVLKAGLSGQAAEEFAYLATKLNAAVPTQDFFAYASAYSSLAANAIKNGKSQSQAIEYANQQLELFASDVLYASRQISGGFSTGLQNASDLFDKATQIALASRIGDPSQIAGVLTSVSAITGAIAPDLASAMVDAIYNAAVGGNSGQLVALRSLAGINASNTEFLRSFATDPQSVFSTLFRNLANMQNMSRSNYMEVAEGLSNTFGISMDSFSRVDFNYLARAIDTMDVSSTSLDENLKQLASGESTQTAEQMRIRQINEYMVNEGLSYVLDNQVAQAIQQHMWDEQIAGDIMENQFAVDLVGSSNQLMTSIVNLIETITDILMPWKGALKTITNIARTREEASLIDDRIKKILEAGKVGQGNQKMLYNLTTTGKDLKLTNSYLSMLAESNRLAQSTAVQYTWGTLGKSAYKALGTSSRNFSEIGIDDEATKQATLEAVNLAKLANNYSRMESSISKFLATNLNDQIEEAVQAQTEKLAANAVVSQLQINKLAKEYLKNPEKYGIGSIGYESTLGKEFNEGAQARALQIAQQKAESDLRKQLEVEMRGKAESYVQKLVDAGKFGQVGYDAWAATASKYGITDLAQAYSDLGILETDVKNFFDQMEAQAQAKKALQREKDEETFWSESQRYLDLINTNIHDVFDKGDIMGILWPGLDEWLNDIDSGKSSTSGSGFRSDMYERLTTINSTIVSFQADMNQWRDKWWTWETKWDEYYIQHSYYNARSLGGQYSESWAKINAAEKQSSEDRINALAEALATNPIGDLMDPTVQQNVLIAQILRVVQGIFQQNNTQGKLKLPDAIAALATGMEVVELS